VAAPGERLPDLWAPGPRGARAAGVGTVVAIGLHGLLALGFATIDPSRFRADKPIEIDIEEKLPPPEVKPPPPPEPKPPPPEPKPRIVHRLPTAAPPPEPPPPSEEPAKADDPPPNFGVSLSATTAGDSSVAVPVGQTLMTKPGPRAEKPKLPSGDGTGGIVPVAEIYIAQHAELISAPSGEDIYPPEAKRLGIEAVVPLKIVIDANGNVVQAKVLERAGHGFDEATLKAIKQAKFKPAFTSDGRAVPSSIIWRYRFETEH
jgi:protein TonB